MHHRFRLNPRIRYHFPTVLTAVLLILSKCNTVALADPPALLRNAAPAADSPRAKSVQPIPRVTISKETTWITEPLRADGYPDYVRYLNEKLSQGVTPQNNAAVVYARAFGPDELPEGGRERFFRMLGVERLADDADYFVDWYEFALNIPESDWPSPRSREETARDALLDQLYDAAERRWTATEFPQAAQYLQRNQRALDLIAEGARRPKFYVPRVSSRPDSAFADVSALYMGQLRNAAQAFAARSTLHLGQGDRRAAWADALTIQLIADQLRGGPELDHLIGITLDSLAWITDTELLRDPKLGRQLSQKILADVATLTHRDDSVRQTIQLHRLAALNAVCVVSQDEPDALSYVIHAPNFYLDDFLDDETPFPPASKITLLTKLDEYQRKSLLRNIHARCDWTISLRVVNAAFDRLDQALVAPDRKTRIELLKEVMSDAKRAHQHGRGLNWYVTLFESQDELSRRVAGLFVGLFVRAMHMVVIADERFVTKRHLIQLGAALAAYRAEQGEYPEHLNDLVPVYVKAIPVDAYDQPFVYRRSTDDKMDYALYSLGENGKDDNGLHCRGNDCFLDISFHSDWSRFP